VTNTERKNAAAAEFPGIFGLRAFPGQRFVVNRSASYVSRDEVMLYVYTADGLAFSKGTPEELRREVVKLEG
jgi:hypothetical protein